MVSSETQELGTSVRVSKQFVLDKKEGVEQTQEESFLVHRFVTTPAVVDVNMGLTVNLGNYESARISVSIKVPCYKEEADAAFVWARGWVSDRLSAEVKSIRDRNDTSIL